MVCSDKIESAKNCFTDIRMSGRNNYQKYSYFETKDIFPIVRKVCKEFNLKTQFSTDYESNLMILTVTDVEDKSTEQFWIRIPELGAGDPGKFMQDVGRVQTYAMRYLYIQCFEITVPDDIDNRNQDKMTGKKGVSRTVNVKKSKGVEKKPVKPASVKSEVKSSKPVDANGGGDEKVEVSEDDVKEALDHCYEVITDYGKDFTEAGAIFQLGRLYKDKPELVRACKQALKTYTADKLDKGE